MAETTQGYRDIPEEDRKKAKVFFDRGRTVGDTGNYEYAIEMYLQGLNMDPDAVEAHQALRDISLKRKASGGKDLGIFEKIKLKRSTKEDKQGMLVAAKMLAYDPGNTDTMVTMMQAALRSGFYDTVLWLGPILLKANNDSKSPDFGKFIVLKDTYKELRMWKLASDACMYAIQMRPMDMGLQTESKNLAAQHTMDEGKYSEAGSFRKSMKDASGQDKLIEEAKDVRSADFLMQSIVAAEAEYQADPNETGKLMKLVDALLKTEKAEHDQQAMDLLMQTYERTRQFRFRLNWGKIKLNQLTRQDRALRGQIQANPAREELKQEYAEFFRGKVEAELSEYKLWSENYPTDMSFRFHMAVRLFMLDRHKEAIPVFQQSRNDPKFKIDSGIYLGRCFLEARFFDEAADTLKGLIEEYQLKGDQRSKDMYYWYGRTLEGSNDAPGAIKCYSQVAQWDFNYRDVQARIHRLRGQ